jgi:hypothetical protein
MLESLLGIDSNLLRHCGAGEQRNYRLALIAFACACVFMVLSDAYFGYLFSGSILGTLVSALCLGFIHFSIYRLALITLTTRPLSEETVPSQNTTFKQKLRRFVPDGGMVFRVLFVGLIALAVSFPAATALNHSRSESIMDQHRRELKSLQNNDGVNTLFEEEARFPFLVFETLMQDADFKFYVILFTLGIFLPLFLLRRLRNNPKGQYTVKLKEIHRGLAERHFYATLLDAQDHIDRHFAGQKNLRELVLFEDPPFNTRRINKHQKNFGDRKAFLSFLNRL